MSGAKGGTKGGPKSKSGKLVVAAIDFGTTYSGYAFSFKNDYNENPTKVFAQTTWVAGSAALISLRITMEGNMSDSMRVSPFSKGRKYMVVDAGGETVEITIQEVIDSDKPNTLHSFGGAWGGTGVDAAYENFLTTIIGEKTYDRFKTESAEDHIDLLRKFETKKRGVIAGKTGKDVIKIPVCLADVYQETTGKRLKDRICEIREYQDKVKWYGDKIRLDVDIVKSWFDKSCTDIVQLVKKIFHDDKSVGVNTILLVGGFSESQMLQEAMKRNFPDKRLIIPEEGSLMVLKGATIFGHTI